MVKVKFKDWDCVINKREYRNGRIAMQLVDAVDGENIATATVNVDEVQLAADEVLVKDYSENEGMLAALVAAGVVSPTGRSVPSGFVRLPICKVLVDLD